MAVQLLLSKLDELDMRGTAGEVRTNATDRYSCEPLHMDKQMLDDQIGPIFKSSVPIQNVAWRTCRERLTVQMGSEKMSGKSLLAALLDDDDDNIRDECIHYTYMLFPS